MTRLTHNQFATLLNGIGELHAASRPRRLCTARDENLPQRLPSDWAAGTRSMFAASAITGSRAGRTGLRGPDEATNTSSQAPF